MSRDILTDQDRRFLRFVVPVVTFLLLQFVVNAVSPHSAFAEWFSVSIQTAAGLFTAYACFRARSRLKQTSGRLRTAWAALGLGGAAFVLMQLVWVATGHRTGDSLGFAGIMVVPSAAFIPFGCVAFLSLGSLPEGNAARARAFLDGLTVGTALMFATWLFSLHHAMDNAVDLNVYQRALTFLDPTQGVLFIALVVSVYTTCRPKENLTPVTGSLLLAGSALFMVSQTIFTGTTHPAFIPGSLIDTGWTAGLGVIGLAALYPRATLRKSDRRRSRNVLGQVLPGLAATIVLGLVFDRFESGDTFDFISLWLAACLIICVLVRQVVTSVEEQRLGIMMEARVVDRTQELSRAEQQFRALVQNSSDVIVILNADGKFDYLSPSIQYVLGHSVETLKDGSITDIVLPDDRTRVMALIAMATRRSGTTMTAEWRVRRADGSLRQVEVLVRNLLEEPAVAGIVLNLRDVTERKELEDQLTHQALHDDLTGLANRSLLRMRIEQALARWLFQNEPFCLTVVDLDDFKAINDSFGHVAGDTVLKTLSERIAECTRRGDTIVRLGSDEFAVLLEGVAADDAEAHNIAQRIIEAVQEPMRVEGHELRMRASIGMACVTDQVAQADDIMRNADLALHSAKQSHRGQYVQFEVQMHDAALKRVEMEGELRKALENDEFQLYYQPTMSIATDELVGVEALLRWPHPTKGFISPADFIPVAEESGLIVQIGTWVLRQACFELAKWQGRYPTQKPLKMNVNLSGRQLDQPNILDVVRQAIEDTGVHPGSLVLEMTESVLMDNKKDTIVKMNELVALGCELAIDDFGTGYSSLSYLRMFPISILKIDRSFVMGLGGDEKGEEAALVQAIVDLSRTLNLKTVAEGIETHAQLDELRRMGCDVGQGFLLARPAPAEDVRRLIESTHALGSPMVVSAHDVD